MAKTSKASASLSARKRARLATERDRERIELREKKLSAAFTALDERDSAERAVGLAIIELKDLGGTQAAIADELGLATREVSRMIALAEDEVEDVGEDLDDASDVSNESEDATAAADGEDAALSPDDAGTSRGF